MAEQVTIGGQTYVRRGPLVVLGLTIITLGIYGIYWHWRTNKDASLFLQDPSIRAGISLLAVTLGGFLIVPALVSIYRTGERIRRMERRVGVAATISPVLYLLLHLVIGALTAAWGQDHINRAFDAAKTRGSDLDAPLPPPPV